MINPLDGGVTDLDSAAPATPQKPNHHTSPRGSWAACRVPGCTASLGRSATWGIYCPRHKINDRRWGHPLQSPLQVRELDPYLRIVKRIRERNAGTDWSAVYARWRAVVDVASSYLDGVRKGQAHVGYRRQAAELITQIGATVSEARVVDLLMSVYLAAEFDPARFKSDEGFRACLLHVVRREAGAGRRFDCKRGGREKASYRILSAKTRETAARWIVEALGPVGVHVARKERARVNAAESTKAAYDAALASIT